ncbi:MAG TPA: signal recognition particle-docking protein FtsY, partial [Firmicutes bacterium]|nr:signal recognition particle-docking protein FtsY [Bacillota bacterium]
KDAASVTGIVLTKIDSTIKPGAIVPIFLKFKIPILFLGTGEGVDDIETFNPRDFVDSLISPFFS